jgi:hypothetical protein
MIGDYYGQKWHNQMHNQMAQGGLPGALAFQAPTPVPISREEFDALKKEVLDMKELLKRAVEYDKRTGQPDCHMDEKVAMLKKVAEAVGVSLDDVFKPKEGK